MVSTTAKTERRSFPRAILAILSALAISFFTFGLPPKEAHAQSISVASADELFTAIADAGNEPTTIEVANQDITVDQSVVIAAGQHITLVGAGANSQITRGSIDASNPVVSVQAGAHLTLEEANGVGLTISANDTATRVLDNRGVVDMKAGLLTGAEELRYCRGISPDYQRFCGAVTVAGEGAVLNLSGGAIADNTVAYTNADWETDFLAGNLWIGVGGTLNMTGGEIRGGKTATYNYFTTGGIGTEFGATLNISGGKIHSNHGGWGGGISIAAADVYKSRPEHLQWWKDKPLTVLNLSGDAEISDNSAGFGGGGINVFGKGEVYMSGGVIHDNVAPYGGGVNAMDDYKEGGSRIGEYSRGAGMSVFGDTFDDYSHLEDWANIVPAAFVMTGGTIRDNFAYMTGGGVNVVSNRVSLQGGEIIDNAVSAYQGQGGGVYVSTVPYVLRVNNAVVYDNVASIGGGLWNCPTGSTHIELVDGTSIFDNQAHDWGNDMAAENYTGIGGRPLLVPNRLIGGGGLLYWFDDSLNSRYDANNPGDPLIMPDGGFTRQNAGYQAVLAPQAGDAAKQVAKDSARLVISGNTAYRGGGLGSNGSIVSEPLDDGEKLINLSVTKAWDDVADQRPDHIDVTLCAVPADVDATWDGTTNPCAAPTARELQRARLSADTTPAWTAQFTGLPPHQTDAQGNPLTVYRIGEVLGVNPSGARYKVTYGEWETPAAPAEPSDPAVGGNEAGEDAADAVTTITNTQVMDLKVTKAWELNDRLPADTPEVTVVLFNGDTEVSRAVLNAANEWTHTFTDLPVPTEANKYRIEELTIDGFTSSVGAIEKVDADSYQIAITNTQDEPEWVNLRVHKAWEDIAADRPASVDVELCLVPVDIDAAWDKTTNPCAAPEAQMVANATLSATTTPAWTAEFTDLLPLPVDADGNPTHVYRVGETLPTTDGSARYQTLYGDWSKAPGDLTSEMTITNTQLMDLTVNKVWDLDADQPADTPKVTVALYADDQVIGQAVLSADNGWSHVFGGLPVSDAGVHYRVKEIAVDGFTTHIGQITRADANTWLITVTNTQDTPDKPEKPSTPPKEPDMPSTGFTGRGAAGLGALFALVGAALVVRRRAHN